MYLLTLTESCCYFNRFVSIIYDGDFINVFRERDKTLLEHIQVGRNHDSVRSAFLAIKTTYIFDYDCEL